MLGFELRDVLHVEQVLYQPSHIPRLFALCERPHPTHTRGSEFIGVLDREGNMELGMAEGALVWGHGNPAQPI